MALHPALKNAPKACQIPDAWKSKATVTYPYKGVDQAKEIVPSMLAGVSSLDKAYDVPAGGTIPRQSLGFDTGAEKAYHNRLRDLANASATFPEGPTGPRKQINALAKAGREYLNLINDYYATDTRTGGVPMSRALKIGEATDWGPATVGMITARNNLRHDIVDAYRNAAQLIWCATYGKAEVLAYLSNREAFEAPIKPSPGGLVDPAWTNYQPIEYQGAEWDIADADLAALPIPESEEQDFGDDTSSAGMGAGIALAGLAVGALLLLTRK